MQPINILNMKTTAIHYTAFGDTAIVQIMCEPFATFPFAAGTPELKNGGLVIEEVHEGGVVGTLIAENKTDSFLLLTDSDMLIGARQNRILNKSLLLAPRSRTVLDVSCIERGRWHYNSKTFSGAENSADPNLRKAKAKSMSNLEKEDPGQVFQTQKRVWQHISSSMETENFSDRTESYFQMAQHHFMLKFNEFPECKSAEGCNGLAVVSGGKVQCIDIFGNTEVYRNYFPILRDSAFRIAGKTSDANAPDQHEAFFRVNDTMDVLGTLQKSAVENYRGAGTHAQAENEAFIGFELSREKELVHIAVLAK
jgi:hypothetical protein